ncbi:MAG TPA: sigma-70 family RNA polymerase sigma factor [Actinomycetes bacterium]|jgi:RNA polymerase sigma-70 factor (ECF subfamily)|nr:sigma-70 family RNA polymerase sigma factor [Actinomycetes bacterium]
MDGTSSSTLRKSLAAGEPGALEQCYLALGPLVRSYLRRYVPNDEVEDITQIVFLEVWRFQRRYDPRRSLEGWMLGIARKRAIDHLRARPQMPVPLELVAEPRIEDGDETAARLARSLEVRRALVALPAQQREAIELAYFADLTQRQIADRLKVPIGTVKARMARGMHRLASLLDQPVADGNGP